MTDTTKLMDDEWLCLQMKASVFVLIAFAIVAASAIEVKVLLPLLTIFGRCIIDYNANCIYP
jgi:hypothetical protein